MTAIMVLSLDQLTGVSAGEGIRSFLFLPVLISDLH